MPLSREERKLLHQKSKQPTLGVGRPDNQDGYEGDISFRQIDGSGTVEYVKKSHEWVAVASSGEMPPVRIIGGTRGAVGSGVGITSHGDLAGLGDDNHVQYLLVDGTRAMTSTMTIGADADGTDRSVVWGHTTLKTIMGIDDSSDAFVINTDAAFDATLANNSFSIDASHNVIIAGNMTVGTDLTVTGGDIIYGNGQNATNTITATAHDTAGKPLTISAGDTTAGTTNNIAGGALTFQGGQGKGSGAGGDIIFQTANAGSSGSSLNALATALTISDDLSATFTGSIDVDGTSNLDDVDIDGDVDISGDLTLSAGGDGALQFASAGENSIRIPDGQSSALIIEEAGNAYMTFTTTNSGEKVTCNKHLYVGTIKDNGSVYSASGAGWEVRSDEDIDFIVRQDGGGAYADHPITFKDYDENFLQFFYNTNLAIIKTATAADNLEINSQAGDISFKKAANATGLIFDLDTAGACYVENGAGDAVVAIDDGDRRLYFFDKGDEYIVSDGTDLTIAAGTALNITADIIDLSDATKDVTLNSAVDALNFDSNTLSIDASNNRIGVGTAAPLTLVHLNAADPVLLVKDTETGAASANARLRLAESGGSDVLGEYWDIHHSGLNLLLTRSDGTGNVVIRSSYITDHAVTSKPATNGRHFATGDADYQQNYSWIGLYDQLALASEHDADFGDWS